MRRRIVTSRCVGALRQVAALAHRDKSLRRRIATCRCGGDSPMQHLIATATYMWHVRTLKKVHYL
jgi:hypothetical protein